MRHPIRRWLVVSAVFAVVVFVLAGTWRDPWLWTYVSVWSALVLYAVLSVNEDLGRERFQPPTQGADHVALRWIRITALAHLIVGLLDGGRWHLTPVPPTLRAAAIAGTAIGFGMFFRAMRQNRFFSSVVRVQSERGHRVVDTGPYAFVRHPGYAGMVVGSALNGLALGSWAASLIGVMLSLQFVRRARFEDRFLAENLAGYASYANRVRYRLIPRVW